MSTSAESLVQAAIYVQMMLILRIRPAHTTAIEINDENISVTDSPRRLLLY